jgi:hypothetical protein
MQKVFANENEFCLHPAERDMLISSGDNQISSRLDDSLVFSWNLL